METMTLYWWRQESRISLFAGGVTTVESYYREIWEVFKIMFRGGVAVDEN
jgi:hypothetical protein